jgi:hypothetical protein
MNKIGAILILLNIVIAATIIAIGFKVDNMLFPLVIGFATIAGIILFGNLFKIAKRIADAIEQTTDAWSTIKNLFAAFYNSFDILGIIGQIVFYLLIVSSSPTIFTSIEIPKNFKTKNLITIISIAVQLLLTILKKFMDVEIFTEVIIGIALITAFLIYDINVDINKKKVDKYSYK